MFKTEHTSSEKFAILQQIETILELKRRYYKWLAMTQPAAFKNKELSALRRKGMCIPILFVHSFQKVLDSFFSSSFPSKDGIHFTQRCIIPLSRMSFGTPVEKSIQQCPNKGGTLCHAF